MEIAFVYSNLGVFPQMHRAIELLYLAIITHKSSTHKMMTYIILCVHSPDTRDDSTLSCRSRDRSRQNVKFARAQRVNGYR